MSAEASIPAPLLPGKDPPPATSSASLAPTPNLRASTSRQLPLSGSRSMPPPLRPNSRTRSSLSLQTLETQAPSRPSFNPFFTLINDSTTKSTHHPSQIHYIFSDDDESEALTAACARSLQNATDSPPSLSPAASRELSESGHGTKSGTSSSSSATFKKGDGRGRRKDKEKVPVKREERVIIVDINEIGDVIVSASSLSSTWQVVNAEIANAPTLNNENTGGQEEERGFMLRIEGVALGESSEEMEGSGEKTQSKGVGEISVMCDEEMQMLMESFDRKMVLLRKIVASGESWDEARREKGVDDGDIGKEA